MTFNKLIGILKVPTDFDIMYSISVRATGDKNIELEILFLR